MSDAPPPYEQNKGVYTNPSGQPDHPYTGAYPPQQPMYPAPSAPPPAGAPPGNYYPVQQGQATQYYFPQSVPNTTTVVYAGGQPVIIQGAQFHSQPVSCTCPHCHAQVVTSVTYETGLLPWLVCGGLFLIGCQLGCCLIPFCINDLKDAKHHCPNCKAHLGRYRRI